MSPDNPKQMRQYKQIGVDYVLTGGPEIPWTEKSLRQIMDPFKTENLTVINMMIGGNQNIIYGREGRDKEIKDIQDSIICSRGCWIAGDRIQFLCPSSHGGLL